MCDVPKVSVVIPVYNTAPYLRQCLDSVLAQTLREIELICVDDGSTDGSAAILKEYASKSPVSCTSINILTQENAGQSVARNIGTAHARGKYIYYLDNDDALHPHALERLYQVAEALRLDILFLTLRCCMKRTRSGSNFSMRKDTTIAWRRSPLPAPAPSF